MKINKWISDVVRMKISRINKAEITRLDCAERITNYDDAFFQQC